MFLVVPAYPGSLGQRAVKRLSVLKSKKTFQNVFATMRTCCCSGRSLATSLDDDADDDEEWGSDSSRTSCSSTDWIPTTSAACRPSLLVDTTCVWVSGDDNSPLR